MSLGTYSGFIGEPRPLDPYTLPSVGDVLRFVSYLQKPTLTAYNLLESVAEELLRIYCCVDSKKNIIRFVFGPTNDIVSIQA